MVRLLSNPGEGCWSQAGRRLAGMQVEEGPQGGRQATFSKRALLFPPPENQIQATGVGYLEMMYTI